MFYRIFLFIICVISTGTLNAGGDTWLSIDTSGQTLSVMRGSRIIATFNNISIGRNGVSSGGWRQNGDDRTPLGTFRVAWINHRSPFYRFYGLNYPTKIHALRAYVEGIIDEPTYDRILAEIRANRIPPQNTALGGYVGIHGIGKADRRIHQRLNWTHGCVALTNEQIDKLSRWVRKGTKVVIH